MKIKNLVYLLSILYKKLLYYGLKFYKKVYNNEEIILKELCIINEKLNVICKEIELLKENKIN
jgi:hypothetical protein